MTQVEDELTRHTPDRDTVLSIGVFDGVHLGHKYLLGQLNRQAKERNMLSGVVTFHQHPEDVLFSNSTLPFITNNGEKTALLKAEGIDFIVTLSFTQELAQLSARQFLGYLQTILRMKGLVVGPDFALGKGRDGNVDNLYDIGEEMGFTASVSPPVLINGEVVSSTSIRKALAAGDMGRVHSLLGRTFSFSGNVIAGDHRGTGLGFPTANLEADIKRALPVDGVYATRVHIGNRICDSMTNLGVRPTFGEGKRLIEIFILDYSENIYGKKITVDFIQRIRDEKRFENADELKHQITMDIEQGKVILSHFKD